MKVVKGNQRLASHIPIPYGCLTLVAILGVFFALLFSSLAAAKVFLK